MLRHVIALSVLVSTSLAFADPLSDAKSQVAASNYVEAQALLDVAYASGENGPEQLAEVWRLRGIIAGALEDTASATDAFRRCLALSPGVELPPGTSPKIARPFQAAQALAPTTPPLAISKITTDAPPTLVVIVDADPMQMIDRIRVRMKIDAGKESSFERPLAGQARLSIALPAGGRFDIQVSALDAKGNRLADLGTADVPIVVVAKPPSAPVARVGVRRTDAAIPAPPRRSRPLYARWWLWGGASVVVAATAGYFGLAGLSAADDLRVLQENSTRHSFDEAKSVESRVRRDFLAANIGFGVAGAFAVTATILALTTTTAERPRVTTVPLDRGAALVLGGRF